MSYHQTLTALEEVEFGNPGSDDYLKATPEVNAELRLRLGRLKFGSVEDADEAKAVIAKAFGDRSEEVLRLLNKYPLSGQSLARLAAYLTGGDEGVREYDARVSKAEDKLLDKAVEEAYAGN